MLHKGNYKNGSTDPIFTLPALAPEAPYTGEAGAARKGFPVFLLFLCKCRTKLNNDVDCSEDDLELK